MVKLLSGPKEKEEVLIEEQIVEKKAPSKQEDDDPATQRASVWIETAHFGC